MPDPRQVLLIIIGVAPIDIVHQGIDEGWLPTIGSVLENGQSARLSDRLSSLFATEPSTALTGVGPLQHEALHARQLIPGTYRLEPGAPPKKAPEFWQFISDAGRPSTILSVYSVSGTPGLRGTQALAWGAATDAALFGPFAEPPWVLQWLDQEVPGRRSGLPKVPRTEPELLAYVDDSLRGVDQQKEGIRLLMDRTEWDLFVTEFPEAHDAGHLLWRFHDPKNTGREREVPPALRSALRRILSRIDAAIAEVVDSRPHGADVFILSPHGVGSAPAPPSAADIIMEAGGWLVRRRRLSLASGLSERAFAATRRAAHRLVPIRMRRAVASLAPRVRANLIAGTALADVDWSRTRAFAIPNRYAGAVRVNLTGREPAGTVPPGPDYERLLAEITATLEQATDADTGAPSVEEVVRTDELLGSPPVGAFPDLVFVWKGVSPRRLRLFGGTIDLPPPDAHYAAHTPEAFLAGMGSGIEPSGRRAVGAAASSLLDVAPTILTRLGARIPPELPGRPMEAFLLRPTSGGGLDRARGLGSRTVGPGGPT